MVLVLALAAAALVVAGGAPVPVAADSSEAHNAPASQRLLTVGGNLTCSPTFAGVLKCFGNNGSGQLGIGDAVSRGDTPGEMGDSLPATQLGTGRTAVELASDTNQSCFLLDNGGVKCWGFNSVGQLGQGNTTTLGDQPSEVGDNLPLISLGTGRTAVHIAAGAGHACAILDNGSLKCWGFNSSGQLGLGDTAARGDGPNEMGDNLLAVDLGTGRTPAAVTVGDDFTCALLDDGSVKCWGNGGNGQLGQGDSANRGDGPNEMGDDLPAVALGTGRTAVAISAGKFHACALLDNATVKCWGWNVSGQLGLGDTANRGDNPTEMGDSLPAVALGTGRTAVAISAGAAHDCALLDNATVKCWGANFSGQLGRGDTTVRGDNTNEMGDNLAPVALGTGRTAVAVTAGNGHSCARLDDGSLKCWGDGSAVGQGNNINALGDEPGEMGDALPAVQLVTPAPAVTVGLTADETTVAAGVPIQYHVTVTNTGNVG